GEDYTAQTYIYGGNGNDTIYSNGYGDIVYTGEGNNTVYSYSAYHDEYLNSNGWSEIYTGSGNNTIYLNGSITTRVYLGDGITTIHAEDSTAQNWITGGNGYSEIYGGQGNIWGGDIINTGTGNALVQGGDNNDDIGGGGGGYGSKSDTINAGGGNDTITAVGKSIVNGEAGNDVIYFSTGDYKTPSALTINGGLGNDVYTSRNYNDEYGVDQLIASEGNDTIQFTFVDAGSIKSYKDGDNLVFAKNALYDKFESLLILKDYYSNQAIYGTEENQSAKTLFDNWKVETYVDSNNSAMRGNFTLTEFINYLNGGIYINTTGNGTDTKDYIEASATATSVDAKSGDDNIVTGKKVENISCGLGNDIVMGNSYANVHFITGDGGTVTHQLVHGQYDYMKYYDFTYTPAENSSLDGNDNITSYAKVNYVWGEGGDDRIVFKNEGNNNFTEYHNHVWGGAGNDYIETYGNQIETFGGEGNDTIFAKRGAFTTDGGAGDDLIELVMPYSDSAGISFMRDINYDKIIADATERGDNATAELYTKLKDPYHYAAYGHVFGGEGNDTIISHTGPGLFMGGADNDTYIIDASPYAFSESYPDDKSEYITDCIINDTEGTNTVEFKGDKLASNNLTVWTNVTLTKQNGEFVKDESGNYEYEFTNYKLVNSDYEQDYSVIITNYGDYHNAGITGSNASIKFDKATLDNLDKITASDGMYINKAQITKMAQKVANWLAENGYDCLAAAFDEDELGYEKVRDNNEQLSSYLGFNALEWLNPEDVTVGATEGLIGTYLSDSLTSTQLNEVFELSTGNDTVTFEGNFGDDVITSDSIKDKDGIARQADMINLKDYSVKDGTLTFAYGDDKANLVITAAEENGSVTYKDFMGSEYPTRSFVLNDSDSSYTVSYFDVDKLNTIAYQNKEKPAIYTVDQKYYTQSQNHINFLTTSGDTKVHIDSGKNYNITFADENTALYYDGFFTTGNYDEQAECWNIVSAEKDIVTSFGETDDTYEFYLTSNSDVIITDMGGNDCIDFYSAATNSTYYPPFYTSKIRMFFDVNADGTLVNDEKHIVLTTRFGENCGTSSAEYNSEELANLLTGTGDHMKGVLTYTGDIEKIATVDRKFEYADNTIDNRINAQTWINSIRSEVADWFENNSAKGYTSVSDVLGKEDADDINAILAIYDNTSNA
ncbi:calcium-binding protein, partial [bacterium]|nr:calcium-binding protein [bacterium]